MFKKKLKINKTQRRVMIQCATAVNKDAVRRESINGVEHIIVSSFTLPDDVVMNGGLYPADEIAKGFKTLERTLAPVEHPTDSDGNFISASDPEAIHNFHAGAFNTNVEQQDGRIHIEKRINVQEALKSERGKRLLDRIEELETSSSPRPVHTSVGVFLDVEELENTVKQVNGPSAGQEYSWIARNLDFDHDALLLDSIGAATPSQGVGMAVNAEGDKVEVQRIGFEANEEEFIEPKPTRDSRTNQSEMSFTDIRDAIGDALEAASFRFDWIDEVFEDSVIFWSGDNMFSVPYALDMTTQRATIVGIPVQVERSVTFTPKANKEGDAMKELMLKALADAGMTVNAEVSDAELLAQYNALQAKQSESDDNSNGTDNAALAEVVANALKPVTEELQNLKAKMNADTDTKLTELSELVGNSEAYVGIDAAAAKLLPLETLESMAANMQPSYGFPNTTPLNNNQQASVKTEMPQ